MKVVIFNDYQNEEKHNFESIEEAKDWLTSQAEKLNYGMFRFWNDEEGNQHIDIGPRVYRTKTILFEAKF